MKSRQLSSWTSPLEHKSESSSSAFWQISSSRSAGISHQHPSSNCSATAAYRSPHTSESSRHPRSAQRLHCRWVSSYFFHLRNLNLPHTETFFIHGKFGVFSCVLLIFTHFRLFLSVKFFECFPGGSIVSQCTIEREKLRLHQLRPNPRTSNFSTIALHMKHQPSTL